MPHQKGNHSLCLSPRVDGVEPSVCGDSIEPSEYGVQCGYGIKLSVCEVQCVGMALSHQCVRMASSYQCVGDGIEPSVCGDGIKPSVCGDGIEPSVCGDGIELSV